MPRTEFTLSMPGFVVDPHTLVRNSGRQVDWSQVGDEYRDGGGIVTVAAGGAALGATAIPINASPVAIPANTVLNFTGTGEFAFVTAAVAIGAVSIPVEALDAAIEAGDTAVVPGSGKKRLRAGTVIGESVVGGVSKIAPRVAGTRVATGLLATDAIEDDRSAATSGYGVLIGGVIYQNLLPQGAPDNTTKTELNTAGTGFVWETYADNRNA